MTQQIEQLLGRCLAERGEEATKLVLERLLESAQAEVDERVLTIVANAGVHAIPADYLRGHVFAASHGNWNVNSDEDLQAELTKILLGVAIKLKERTWSKIYLIPTGHPAVSMQIKTLVYRTLRLNTIDIVYLNGTYYILDLDQRQVALMAPTNSMADGLRKA